MGLLDFVFVQGSRSEGHSCGMEDCDYQDIGSTKQYQRKAGVQLSLLPCHKDSPNNVAGVNPRTLLHLGLNHPPSCLVLFDDCTGDCRILASWDELLCPALLPPTDCPPPYSTRQPAIGAVSCKALLQNATFVCALTAHWPVAASDVFAPSSPVVEERCALAGWN